MSGSSSLSISSIIIIIFGCITILLFIPWCTKYIYFMWKFQDHLFIRKRRPIQVIIISILLIILIFVFLPILLYN